mmetsp:Transcript_13348/g.27047  ORF Transcript_13348/g.27047 Transcript_13348/m.27047 type:complete len:84 (-) Transcript_13348:296-547(-)
MTTAAQQKRKKKVCFKYCSVANKSQLRESYHKQVARSLTVQLFLYGPSDMDHSGKFHLRKHVHGENNRKVDEGNKLTCMFGKP